MAKRFFTSLKARLSFVKSCSRATLNWFFLPGGPGLGSESLIDLTTHLTLPGKMWFLDLPGDGSNLVENEEYYFQRWPAALAEAVTALENVILVAHSTGGMLALSTPQLKHLLRGLVIMDSAPNAEWQRGFARYCKTYPLPKMDALKDCFLNQPTNDTLRKLTLASLPHVFTQKSLAQGLRLFENLPYNLLAYLWSANNFDNTYRALWIPSNIPTLILAGENDRITPLSLFKNAKEFNHPNIRMQPIKNAGHFPWIENPQQIQTAFSEYIGQLNSLPHHP